MTISCHLQLSSNKNQIDLLQQCLNEYDPEGPKIWPQLLECSRSDQELKQNLQQITESIQLNSVPQIMANDKMITNELSGEYYQTEDVKGTLIESVCNLFDESVKPSRCFEIVSPKLELTLYITGTEQTGNLIKNQVKPLLTERTSYLQLRDVIHWKVIPWGNTVYDETKNELKCSNGDKECSINRMIVSMPNNRSKRR